MCTCINVVNKSDLLHTKTKLPGTLFVSANTGQGVESLRNEIYKKACGNIQSDYNGLVLTNERHISCIRKAQDAVAEALETDLAEAAVSSINRAISEIDEVSGLKVSERIIDQIFSQFCVGK